MKHILSFSIALVLFTLSFNALAQELSMPSFSYSEKKPAYFTLKSGNTVEATISDLKYKKGQVSGLKLKDSNKKNIKMTPADINYMYLPQSTLNKLVKLDNLASNATLWKSNKLDNEMISKGYVYFESTDVKMGKKTRTLLMQVLNPAFCSKVKVYHDPFAKETASVGVGGITVAGGDAKSYYFKKGEGAAIYLNKKDYKKQFNEIWNDCPTLIEKFGENPKWTDLAKHIYEYSIAGI